MEMNEEKNIGNNLEKGKKNKNYIIIGVIIGCLLFIGGTYALITANLSVNNGNVNGVIECFQINYNIDNGDGTSDITGVLLPTKNANGGLFGKVAIGVNSSCNVTGKGTLFLAIESTTSSMLLQTVDAHCEKTATLETMSSYTTSSTCTSNGGTWVTNGTALKYAVFNSSSTTGTALSKGYITAGDIGKDVTIYNGSSNDGFTVNGTTSNYYIYIWMDGYLAGDGYENLHFGGSIHAQVVQSD